VKKVIDDEKWLKKAKYPIVIDSSTQGEIADPWEQQGLTPYGQYFEFANIKEHGKITTGTDTGKKAGDLFLTLGHELVHANMIAFHGDAIDTIMQQFGDVGNEAFNECVLEQSLWHSQ
jgi:hypothetical protein